MNKQTKLKKGTIVTVNIPFTYEIGEEGYQQGKKLLTIEDCENEVRAELTNSIVTGSEVFLESKIQAEFTPDLRAPVSYSESDREETNLFCMTLEDLHKHGYIHGETLIVNEENKYEDGNI